MKRCASIPKSLGGFTSFTPRRAAAPSLRFGGVSHRMLGQTKALVNNSRPRNLATTSAQCHNAGLVSASLAPPAWNGVLPTHTTRVHCAPHHSGQRPLSTVRSSLHTTALACESTSDGAPSNPRAGSPHIYHSPISAHIEDSYVNALSFAFPPAEQDRFPPTAPAFIDARTGLTLSRGDVRRLALELGYGLRHVLPTLPGASAARVRLERGDALLVLSPNGLAFPLAAYGALAAGLRCTLANAGSTPRELLLQLRETDSRVVFAHPALVHVALEALALAGLDEREARARVVVCDYRGLGGEIAKVGADVARGLTKMEDLLGQGQLEHEEHGSADDTAFMCFSSGTTGDRPKGIETTHRNVIYSSQMLSYGVGISKERETYMGVLPLYHIYGLCVLLFQAAFIGAPAVMMERFDPAAFAAAIERYKVTCAYVVPPVLLALLRHPATAQHDLRSLRTVVSGAAPLGGPLVRDFDAMLRAHGADVAVLQGYGLTETAAATHVVPRASAAENVGSIGVLLPSLEARIVADDAGTLDAPLGERGELWLRGPSVMKGYLGDPETTRKAITEDGWLKTGDIATCNAEGFYTIVDRKKELIKYKGFQVAPAELESLLLQHPGVADAAVIGIDAPSEATELPRGYVVPTQREILASPEAKDAFAVEVVKWVSEHVARHKRLRGGCEVVDAIPKSASGKILRKVLRAAVAEPRK